MDNWTAPKYNFMKHTIVLGGSQFTCSIPLSNKREAKIKKIRPDFCVRQVYFTSKSWRQIWWRVNQPFKHTFFHHVWGKQYYEALFFFNFNFNFFLSYRPRIEFVLFLRYLNLQFCSFSQFCKTNWTHSISKTIEARASFAQQIIALTTS